MADPEPSVAAELAAVRNELREMRKEMKRSAKFEEHWKGLEVVTQPISGLGFFALGVGLPMIVAAAQSNDLLKMFSGILPGTVLILLAVVTITLPLQLQGYFLGKPSRIYSFFRELERNEGRNPLLVMKEWAETQGDAAKPVRAAIAQAIFIAKTGFWSIVLFAGAFLALYFALMTLIVLRGFGPVVAILFLVAIGLGTIGIFVLAARRKKAASDDATST